MKSRRLPESVAAFVRSAAEMVSEGLVAGADANQLRAALASALRARGNRSAADAVFAEILEQDPSHLNALLGRIDIARTTGRPKDALALCAEGLLLHPGNFEILRRKGAALEKCGQHDKAVSLLSELVGREPENRAAKFALASALRARGSRSAADKVFAEILEQDPSHLNSLLGRIDIARTTGRPKDALALCAEGLLLHPGNFEILRRKGAALEKCGQHDEAVSLLSELVGRKPEHTAAQLSLAYALKANGDPDGADKVFSDILKRQPGHVSAQLGRIDAALGRRDPDAALAHSFEALSRRPQDPRIRFRRAKALHRSGQLDAARDILEGLMRETPDDIAHQLEHAQLHLSGNEYDAANALYSQILKRDPNSDGALFGLLAVAEKTGEISAALGLLESRLKGEGAAETRRIREIPSARTWEDARLSVRYIELCVRAGEPDRALTVARGMHDRIALLPASEKLRLGKAAERAGAFDIAGDVITNLAEQTVLSPEAALHFVRLAHSSGNLQLAAELAAVLSRDFPNLESTHFREDVAMQLYGPDAALAEARRLRLASRSLPRAVRLASQLLAAGESRLALRYLRHCDRRWPNAPQLRPLLITACIQSGRPDDGWSFLDRWSKSTPEHELGNQRIRVLVASENMQAAFDLARKQRATGGPPMNAMQYLRLCLSNGTLPEAREAAREAANARDQGRKKQSQFSITHLGALLNELEIYTHAISAPGTRASFRPGDLESRYFFAAKATLDDWLKHSSGAGLKADAGHGEIPKKIVQYWDTPDLPPGILGATRSWQRAEGYDYRRFDKAQAIDFLATRFDREHVKAFRLANHVAEESDFLRLCVLFSEGGIYADSDDKLMGHPDELISLGSGVILFREPFGALSNNVICARPGHKLVGIAVDMAREALLARENDNTWSKTGPGLLTRAAASYLVQVSAEEAQSDLTIVPQVRMRPCVYPHMRLPHKSTANYWDAASERTKAPIVDALKAILAKGSDQADPV